MMKRELTYAGAISEALVQAMERDPNVFIIGLEADGERGIFGTTREAALKFPDRVFDAPLSEAGITGWGTGAALAGMRPVMVHARVDFLMLAADQIINHAAKWQEMTGGAYKVPWVIRALIGRGKGQGAQHAQALHALFAHVPGLKVVLPSNAYDAKGLLTAAIEDDGPVIFIEHRWLFDHISDVPADYYKIPLGKASVASSSGFLVNGDLNQRMVTIVSASYMTYEAMVAMEILSNEGVFVEVVDLSTVQPLDILAICESVQKTGKVIIADVGGVEFGVGAEIAAQINERLFSYLKAPPVRIGLPHASVPTASRLEAIYYPGVKEIVLAAKQLNGIKENGVEVPEIREKKFQGPF